MSAPVGHARKTPQPFNLVEPTSRHSSVISQNSAFAWKVDPPTPDHTRLQHHTPKHSVSSEDLGCCGLSVVCGIIESSTAPVCLLLSVFKAWHGNPSSAAHMFHAFWTQLPLERVKGQGACSNCCVQSGRGERLPSVWRLFVQRNAVFKAMHHARAAAEPPKSKTRMSMDSHVLKGLSRASLALCRINCRLLRWLHAFLGQLHFPRTRLPFDPLLHLRRLFHLCSLRLFRKPPFCPFGPATLPTTHSRHQSLFA